jgi:hypothetical protein
VRETLQDVIAAELPPLFVSGLVPRLAGVYREVVATMQHPLLGEPEKRNLLPHARRNMVEKAIRDLALDHGLIATVEWAETGSCQFTAIRTPRVLLTVSKTQHDWALPETCHFRRQNSAVNSMLMQSDFFDASAPSRNEQEPLYAILTHGPSPGSDDLGFVCIGFPRADMEAWAEAPISILDIQEKQERVSKVVDSLAEQEEELRTPALKEGVEKGNDADADPGHG